MKFSSSTRYTVPQRAFHRSRRAFRLGDSLAEVTAADCTERRERFERADCSTDRARFRDERTGCEADTEVASEAAAAAAVSSTTPLSRSPSHSHG